MAEAKPWRSVSVSYQQRIEEMIGKHIGCFQTELTLANELASHKRRPSLPYGYPPGVYRPLHLCNIPQYRQFVSQTGGCLSNGVPRVLSAEWHDGSLLGVYNPRD
jgi:hypothetical protein